MHGWPIDLTPGTDGTAATLRIDVAKVTKDGLLNVEGWAVSPALINSLQVFLGHRFVGPAELGRPRADIGLAFPHDPRAAWSGFLLRTEVTGEDLSDRIVRARVLLQDGRGARVTAPLEIATFSYPPALPEPTIHAACEHCTVLPDGRVSVSGWAVSFAGISKVALALDDGDFAVANLGLPRPDIGNRFPRIPSARHSGFAFLGRLHGTPEQTRFLRVDVQADDGREQRIRHTLHDSERDTGEVVRGVGRDLANKIKFFVDTPELVRGVARLPPHSSLTIQGWAIGQDGIATVEVQFDGADLGPAFRGLQRPDIASAFPHWPDVRRCGFVIKVLPKLLTSGRHRVCITVRDRVGREAETAFQVDAKADAPRIATILPGAHSRQADTELDTAILETLGDAPCFAVILQLAGTGSPELGRARTSLRELQSQTYENWRAVLLLPARTKPEMKAAFVDSLGELAQRVTVRAVAEPPRRLGQMPGSSHLMILRAGDRLGCNALMELALEASLEPRADFVYGDEFRFDPAAGYEAADFRPQWSPDLLLSCNYIGRTWCARTELFEASRLTEGDLVRHGTYEVVLRLTEVAKCVRNVPKILCHTIRTDDNSATARAALDRALRRRHVLATVEPSGPGVYRVRRAIHERPLVSIIIPTCGRGGLFRNAILSIRSHTHYAPMEIVAVDNIPKSETEAKAWLRDHADRVVPMPGAFNWSAFNNEGARIALGQFLMFLNDDVEVGDPGWLEALMEQAQRPEVGAVGARLLYPDGKIQHAGVTLSSMGGVHLFRFMPGSYGGPFGRGLSLREVSAVTGACLMVRRDVFDGLAGFDEAHAIINNDLEFCLRVRACGLKVLYTPYAELVHHELASRGHLPERFDKRRFNATCGLQLAQGDPYTNPNLLLGSEDAVPDSEPTRTVVVGGPILRGSEVHRIVALKVDHLGDFVTAFPALRRLKDRFPAAELHVVCSPASAELARLEPSIDQVITLAFFHPRSSRGPRRLGAPELKAMREQLDGQRYDIAVDLRKHPETRHLLQVFGARMTAGFDRGGKFGWLDVAVEWDGNRRRALKRRHVGEDLLRLAEAVSVACEQRRSPAPLLSAAAAPAMPPATTRRRPRVCVHPAAGLAIKQWPVRHYAALIDLLAEAEDAEFVLIGTSDEQAIAAQVMGRTRCPDRVTSLLGQTELRDLPGLLQGCDLFIGNDSGPKHLAASLGVPTVSVHSGVVGPEEWGPAGERAVAVYRQMVCSPCYLTKVGACPRGVACLEGLAPVHVAAACRRLLRSRRTNTAGAVSRQTRPVGATALENDYSGGPDFLMLRRARA